jgi:hypothetical protein
MRKVVMRGRFALALVALLLVPSTAFSAQAFTATLSGAAAVPPNGSTGTASALFVLNDTWTFMTYTVTYTGLSSNLVNATLQHGPAGVNGTVAFLLLSRPGPPSGTFSGAISLESNTISVADLLAGLYYVEIRSFVYTNGELRGQLAGDVTPSQHGTWGRIKALYH